MTRAAAIANPTHIYVLGTDDGLVKIGRTSNPHTRMITLRSQLRVRGAAITRLWVLEVSDAKNLEGHLRFRGRSRWPLVSLEWFRAPFDAFMRDLRFYFAREAEGVIDPLLIPVGAQSSAPPVRALLPGGAEFVP